MQRPVSVLNGNADSFVQHRNKILNAGYVSSFPLSLGAVVCTFLWSTYASYWSDRCSPQQPRCLHKEMEGGREGRQMRDRKKQGREGRNDGE